ncbi:MAG: DUF86 domain-containing protein [Candidatus Methanoplasma sp.]|nr:DUF86 domain-containing protein [Candidatus Methanoplasma sp.]
MQIHKTEWRKIARFRDMISHRYEYIDVLALWEAVTIEVPELKKECISIMREFGTEFSPNRSV